MIRPRRTAMLTATFAWVSAAPGLRARQAPPDVPMDLALALLGGWDPDVTLHIGAVPPPVDGPVPLGPILRVVGSLQRGSQGTIVVEVGGSVREAPAAYRRFLEEQGWTPAPQPRSPRGGFQPSDRYRVEIRCSDAHHAQASSIELDGRTYLRIQYGSREIGRNPCDVETDRAQRTRAPFEGLTLPDLEAPPGAVVRPTGAGSSSDAIDSRVVVETDLGADAVFEHYARQLSAAGWSPVNRSVAGDVAIGRWRTEDDDGGPAVGLLVTWNGVAPGVLTAWVRMEREVPGR